MVCKILSINMFMEWHHKIIHSGKKKQKKTCTLKIAGFFRLIFVSNMDKPKRWVKIFIKRLHQQLICLFLTQILFRLYVQRKKKEEKKNFIPTLKYVAGTLMVYGGFNVSWPVQPAIVWKKKNIPSLISLSFWTSKWSSTGVGQCNIGCKKK